MLRTSIGLFILLFTFAVKSQVLSDPNFDSTVSNPTFAENEGPLVLIDEGHKNYHTIEGRYRPFADVISNDGYRVAAHRGPFTKESLSEAQILVIANAVEEGIEANDFSTWRMPFESAFTDDEIRVLVDWVHDGGALFLIVDYMPVPAMSADLAAQFGIYMPNGYAYESPGKNWFTFTKTAGNLRDHAITNGRDSSEQIESFQTFAGSAFMVPFGADPILLFQEDAYILLPDVMTPPDTHPPSDSPRHPIKGWSQGAVMRVEDGRLAVFGEAAAFSAQLYTDGQVMGGMNHPLAPQNKQLLLNVVHWLTGEL